MDTISEQLRGLGLIELKESNSKHTCNPVENNKELDINHQVMIKLLDLIITRKPW